MKLSEFLPDVFRLVGKGINTDDYVLLPEVLKIPFVKEGLLQCEEFANIEELIILDHPSMQEIDVETGKIITSSGGTEKTKVIKTVSSIIKSGTKFKGKLYLYSFALTPTVCDANDLLKPVKDNITIGPTLYDNENFIPIIPLVMFVNVELIQDNLSLANDFLKKTFLKKL